MEYVKVTVEFPVSDENIEAIKHYYGINAVDAATITVFMRARACEALGRITEVYRKEKPVKSVKQDKRYQVYHWQNGSLVLNKEYSYKSSLLKYLARNYRKGFLVRCNSGGQINWHRYSPTSDSGLEHIDGQNLDKYIQEK